MLGDTILAPASPSGAAARAVLRLSGPQALAAAGLVFEPPLAPRRGQQAGTLRVRAGVVEALALTMPGPGSYTGEDVVELHLPGSPLLLAVVQEDLLARGAGLSLRQAEPGEFTARACRNGRLDLAQAEGILLLLHAADRRAVATGVQWLRGGLSPAIGEVRTRLQDVLALLESGLDFTAGETGTVDPEQVRLALAEIGQRLARLLGELPAAAPGGEVLLLGAANAGKSTLCNALAGRDCVLVDVVAGTTRDLIRVEIGEGLALWDAPGDLDEAAAWDVASLQLRDRLAGRAAAVLVVLDATAPRLPAAVADPALPLLAVLWSKGDLVATLPPLPAALQARVEAGLPVLRTSAVARRGLAELRALLQRSVHAGRVDAGGPLRAALAEAAAAVDRAAGAAAEIAAAELQAALRAFDGIGDRHSPEHLLDRIYGRFCLGK